VSGIRRWPQRPAIRPYRLSIAILGLGLLSIVLWVVSDYVRLRIADQELALTQAASEIRVSLASSHLWLEERLSGDTTNRPEDIFRPADEAGRLARAILEGGHVGPSRNSLRPLDDPALRRKAYDLVAGIGQFRSAIRFRLDAMAAGLPYGVGTPVDDRFDRDFTLLANRAWAFELAVHDAMAVRKARAKLELISLLGLWLTLVLMASAGLGYHQHRRQAAEEALRRSEVQLLQAQKMEAVGRLAGGLAHDINNYIGAITAQCELIQMKAAPGDRIGERMDLVIGTAGKVTALIRRLLAFSRQQPVHLRVVDLNALVDGLRGMLGRLLGEDIHLETYLSPGVWPVRVDPAQVEQVIVNLVVNAREACPQGGRITIETAISKLDRGYLDDHPTAAEGEYALLAVSDDGTGIPPEIRDKIFDPFFTTKEGSEARGLGLSTVYAIAKQNGGHVSVYSEVAHPRTGTTFRISLPRAHEALSAAEPVVAAAEGPAVGHETLLLVEDNDELRAATQGVLEALGYRVLVAEHGEGALAILRRAGARVDLVVCDVVMPGMSGQEVCERIHTLSPGVRVIFISGYTDNVILRHGILAGEFEFLQKPFSIEQLARKVREVLDRELAPASTVANR
jgi:signal transduction histidine kinase/ActR/RegA family two-component response regulator